MNDIKSYYAIFFLLCFFFQGAFAQNIAQYLKANKIVAKEKYGLYYHISQEGKGRFPIKGDYVKLTYKGLLLDGVTFDKTPKGEPFIFQIGYQQVIRGMDMGMTLFKVGSKGQLFIPADLAYGKNGVGKSIPPNAPLVFDIEMLDIMDIQTYNKYMTALEKKERAAFEANQKTQHKKDLKLIQSYALDHKIKSRRTPSGLSYSITKEGKGPKARSGDVVSVAYEGFLLNGEKFDASEARKPYSVTLGEGKLIKGWEEGLQFFNKGAEGWLLIPSQLAYGPRSIEEDGINIAENSVLVFKIKMEQVKKPKQ